MKPTLGPFRNSRGFTLIELILSASLMAVVLAGSYLCLNAALEGRRTIEPRADAIQTGRVVVSMIAADLRAACPLPKGPQFLGMDRAIGSVEADNLDFATHHFSARQEGEGDFCEVSYYLQKDPRTGEFSLWRRRNPMFAFDPLSGGEREELARGVGGFGLEYFDGFDWFDNWGDVDGKSKRENSLKSQPNLSGLPEAVRITLAMKLDGAGEELAEAGNIKSREPPLVFQTIVRLEIPEQSASSGSRGGSSASGGGTPAAGRNPGGLP